MKSVKITINVSPWEIEELLRECSVPQRAAASPQDKSDSNPDGLDNTTPRKGEAEEIELVNGERSVFYPYVDPQPRMPGGGVTIGELENGEKLLYFSKEALADIIFRPSPTIPDGWWNAARQSIDDIPVTDQEQHNNLPDKQS